MIFGGADGRLLTIQDDKLFGLGKMHGSPKYLRTQKPASIHVISYPPLECKSSRPYEGHTPGAAPAYRGGMGAYMVLTDHGGRYTPTVDRGEEPIYQTWSLMRM